MKNNQIYLEHIEKYLTNCLVKLDHKFLKNLFQKVSNSEKPYLDKNFVKEIGLKYNGNCKKCVSLYALFRKNRFIEFRTLQKLCKFSNYDWSHIERNILFIRAGRHGGEIGNIFPVEIDSFLGGIIGHILGDGSITKKYLQVFFTNKDKDLILEFYYSMKKVFHIEPRIWLQESGKFKTKSKWIRKINSAKEIPVNSQIGLFYPSICGIILNTIFDNFAVGKNKSITKPITNASREFKTFFVRAFFDDEGHMDKKRGPRFHQDNKQILEKIKEILIELGINSFPIRKYKRKGKLRHYFNINQRTNYKNYFDIIGCTSKKKSETLRKLIGNKMDKEEKKLLEEQNELIRELIISLEDVKAGRIKPFK
ncbi:MAG: LAGLIDADG family homing endonuclease [archaeon]